VGTPGLIGREGEFAEVAARLRAHRLVTIVGPGGVGKTALAKMAADRLAEGFPLGTRLVDLTRLDDASAVAGAFAAQLGFDSFDALLGAPVDHPVLLLVDNCEHLLDAAAAALARLLGACAQVTVLTTSRAPLEMPGESLVALAPLPLPAADSEPRDSASVALFLERCDATGVEVDDGDLPDAVELCRQLDGLPLALELAAARTRTMSIAEISARLADSVDVLARPRFRGDPRHRSLADTISWSYELLSGNAASALGQLGVFVGPFTAATARSVTGVDDFDEALDELITASLVVADTSGTEAHYRLLDTIRAFARERLDGSGAATAAYDRFVNHVIDRSRAQLTGASADWRPGLLRELIDSFDDIAEALRWCITHDVDPRRSHQLCSALWGVVHQAHGDDIVDIMRRVTERFPGTETRGGVHAVAVLATAEYVTGRPHEALALAEPLTARGGDDLPAVVLHRLLGQARNAVGDRQAAIAAFGSGAEIAYAAGMVAMGQELDVAVAVVRADLDDPEALGVVGEVVDTTAGERSLVAVWARTVYAWLLARHDPHAARAAARSALAEARTVGFPVAVAANLRTTTLSALALGDRADATSSLGELLDDLLERGALSNARLVADPAAALAYAARHPAWPELAATARALPITTLVCSQFELVPVPRSDAAPLARRELFRTVRALLRDLEAGIEPASAVDTTAAIRATGDVYEFEFAGTRVTVRAGKGVGDLVRLIEADGAEIPATELADVGVEQGSTGELLDGPARRDYEQRIRDLQTELDAAEHDNDYARTYRYQVELDTLIDHLTAAVGRGGRTRRGAGNAERARSAVTHRTRAAIRQFERLHPALGRHLAHAVNTGTYCSYRPEHPVTWHVERS